MLPIHCSSVYIFLLIFSPSPSIDLSLFSILYVNTAGEGRHVPYHCAPPSSSSSTYIERKRKPSTKKKKIQNFNLFGHQQRKRKHKQNQLLIRLFY
jgi:hypothetical protein